MPDGHADHRHALGARQLGQLAAGGERDALRARRAGGLEAGERLLGVARVARAEHQRCRGRSRTRARSRARVHRPRGARRPSAAVARSPPIAEPPMPHTTSPPGASLGRDPGRLHAPERVAELQRLREHVAEHALRVDRRDRLAREVAHGSRRARVHASAGSSTIVAGGYLRAAADHRVGARPARRPPRARPRRARSRGSGVGAHDHARRAAPSAPRASPRPPSSGGPSTLCGPTCAPASEAVLVHERAGLVARRAACCPRGRRAGPRSPRGSARASRCRSSSPRRA